MRDAMLSSPIGRPQTPSRRWKSAKSVALLWVSFVQLLGFSVDRNRVMENCRAARWIAQAFCAFATVAAWGCSSIDSNDNGAGAEIGVGYLVYANDISATKAQAAQVAAALREINDAGGLLIEGTSRHFALYTEDHDGTPAGAVAALERFASRGVKFVIGPPWSSLVLGNSPDHSDGAIAAALRLRTLMISGAASASAITGLDDDQLMWRKIPSDSFQAGLGAKYVHDTAGLARAAIIHRNEAWGVGLADTFTTDFEAAGGTITARVGYDLQGDLQTRDYHKELDAVFAGKPDAVYLLNFGECFAILNQMVEGGYLANYADGAPLLFGTDGTFTEDILSNVSGVALGRMKGTSPYADSSSENFQSFVQSLAQAGLGAPKNQDANRYDAVYVLALAMQRANSTDPDKVKTELQAVSRNDPGDLTVNVGEWQKGRSAIESGKGVNYEGASGPIEFSDQGDPTVGYFVIWRPAIDGTGAYYFDLSEIAKFQSQ